MQNGSWTTATADVPASVRQARIHGHFVVTSMLASFAAVSIATGSQVLGAIVGAAVLVVVAYRYPMGESELIVLHGADGRDPA
jgi:hypothetical protein